MAVCVHGSGVGVGTFVRNTKKPITVSDQLTRMVMIHGIRRSSDLNTPIEEQMRTTRYSIALMLALAGCTIPCTTSAQTISASSQSLFLCSDGTVRSWGSDNFGALGNDAALVNQPLPVPVATISGITAVSAGGGASYALKNDGTVWSCGLDVYGQLGDDAVFEDQPTPVNVLFPNTSVSGSNWANTAGNVTGIGSVAWATPANASGSDVATYAVATDVSSTATSNYLVATDFGISVPAGATITGVLVNIEWQASIASARDNRVSLVKGGVVQSTNMANNSNIGTNQTVRSYGSTTALWGSILSVADVEAPDFGVAIAVNKFGSGVATVSVARISLAVFYSTPNTVITAISGGGNSVMALTSSGSVFAWGRNTYGQMGIGGGPFFDDQPTPVQPAISNVMAIACGGHYLLALKNDGTVWSIGLDNYGQLGNDAAFANLATYVQVATLTDITAISAGGGHSLALKSDGTVWSWGADFQGQLGNDAALVNQPTPVQVASLTGVIGISAGSQHSLALKSDGTVWSWGDDEFGQLGDDVASVDHATPVQVATLTDISEIAAGGLHCLALKSDGTVWSWGDDSVGQLGNDTLFDNHPTPVMVVGPCADDTGILEAGAPLNISLFPNPAVEILTITLRGNGRWEQVAIYNSLGGLIETISVVSSAQLSIAELPNGPYYVRLLDHPGKAQVFIKQ
ncbi:MAG: T9SS type A sorting domain-containing protein [Flavobacteriales bacterium]|nr:T9SS type A sorting domain-containing protein [Flavobacteriales bacterium]